MGYWYYYDTQGPKLKKLIVDKRPFVHNIIII